MAHAKVHSVMIHDRGGLARLAELVDISSVEWSRERDSVSSARVIIQSRDTLDQAKVVNSIRARRHELVIYRGDDRVWEGPIAEVAWYSDRVEIVAMDAAHYLWHTPMSKHWPGPEGGGQYYMTDRVQDILTYELTTPYTMDVSVSGGPELVTVPRWEGLTPPINVLPFLEVRSGTVLTRADVVAFQMTVGEHLTNLSRGGLDWTTIGRKILIWDSADSIGQTRTLTDSDFYGEIAVFEDGPEFAAVAHLSASGGEEGEAATGHAGGADPYYGPWTRIQSMDDEEGSDTPNQEALNSQARRYLVGRNPVPIEIRLDGSSLRLSHDLRINQLVAGVQVPVLANMNLRKVAQMQRLDRLTVTEDSSGETVDVALIPAGELVEVL